MMLWPDRFNKYITIFHWFWFANLIALETFHVTYVYVHRADIADMADTTATVTTTFEVGICTSFVIFIRSKSILTTIIETRELQKLRILYGFLIITLHWNHFTSGCTVNSSHTSL